MSRGLNFAPAAHLDVVAARRGVGQDAVVDLDAHVLLAEVARQALAELPRRLGGVDRPLVHRRRRPHGERPLVDVREDPVEELPEVAHGGRPSGNLSLGDP